jgi:cation diffusion facilitator family transporter
MLAADKDQRFPQARRTTWIGMVINLFLISFKVLAGIWGRSEAIIADAVHSASDFITDALVLVGLKISERPKDETHPYGHGRVETIATFLVGLILGTAGLGIGFKAITAMIKGVSYAPKLIALIAALISIIVKEGTYQYTIRKSRLINSQVLKANAWHHRSDALSSVATFLGIGGAMLNPKWLILDPLVACGVAIFIVKIGAEITWGAFSDLVDTSVHQEIRDQMKQVAKAVPGVIGLHKMKTRHVGNEIFVDVHIEVNPSISVTDGHHIATQLERAILHNVDNMAEVNVHVEPDEDAQHKPEAVKNQLEIEKNICQIADTIEGIQGLSRLRVQRHGSGIKVDANIELNPQLTVAEGQKLAKFFREQLLKIKDVQQVELFLNLTS